MWTPDIIEHVAEHNITPEDFEAVLSDPEAELFSDSTGWPAVIGYTQDGRRLFCVYKDIDETYVEPVTAYEIED